MTLIRVAPWPLQSPLNPEFLTITTPLLIAFHSVNLRVGFTWYNLCLCVWVSRWSWAEQNSLSTYILTLSAGAMIDLAVPPAIAPAVSLSNAVNCATTVWSSGTTMILAVSLYLSVRFELYLWRRNVIFFSISSVLSLLPHDLSLVQPVRISLSLFLPIWTQFSVETTKKHKKRFSSLSPLKTFNLYNSLALLPN